MVYGISPPLLLLPLFRVDGPNQNLFPSHTVEHSCTARFYGQTLMSGFPKGKEKCFKY